MRALIAKPIVSLSDLPLALASYYSNNLLNKPE
jgi:hypothetical protein